MQAEADQPPVIPVSGKPAGVLIKSWRSAPMRIAIGLGMLMLVPVAVSILLKVLRWLLPSLDAFVLASPQVPGMPGRVASFSLISIGILMSAFPVYRLFVRRIERRTASELARADFGMADAAARIGHAHQFRRAESTLVEIDGRGGIVYAQVRRDGVVAVGNRLHVFVMSTLL
jgi:hypothetical protein